MDKEKKYMISALFLLLLFCAVLAGVFLYFNIGGKFLQTEQTPEAAYQDEFAYTLWTKVKNADLTDEEFQELLYNLRKQGLTTDSITNSGELRINKNGVTYGPDLFGAELIAAYSDDGTLGYVYRKDLEGDMPKTIEEALAVSGKGRVITVYASDGVTIIGTFTMVGEKE